MTPTRHSLSILLAKYTPEQAPLPTFSLEVVIDLDHPALHVLSLELLHLNEGVKLVAPVVILLQKYSIVLVG